MKRSLKILLILFGLLVLSCGGFFAWIFQPGPHYTTVPFIEEHFQSQIELLSKCAQDSDFYQENNNQELRTIFKHPTIVDAKFSLQPNSFTLLLDERATFQSRYSFMGREPTLGKAVANTYYDTFEDGSKRTTIEYQKYVLDKYDNTVAIFLTFDMAELEKLDQESNPASSPE